MSDSQTTDSTPNGKINGNLPEAGPAIPRLNVEKLHSLPSEQQDLYLFTFAVEFERYVTRLDYEVLSTQQSPLNEQILQIINLPSPYPSKAVRSNIGRALACILGNGNRRTLFESVNQLIGIVNAGKNDRTLANKHAAVYCLGEVYKAAGDSAINLSSLACSSLLKLLKPAQYHAGLRAAIFQALAKAVKAVEKALDESVARDIWKQARKAAGDDKAALVQARACGCLEALIKNTRFFDTTSHFEDVRMAIYKASETHIPTTRHAAASCLAAALVKAYSGSILPKSVSKPKKKKTAVQAQDEVIENGISEDVRPSSPPANKKIVERLELSLYDILKHLSNKYTFPTTSNRMRATMVHCYLKVLSSLGPSNVEPASNLVIDHLLSELLGNPSITHDRYKLLLTRQYVQRILVDCVGLKVLGEAGRMNIARSLINGVLKNFPQVVKEIPAPSKHALVSALEALATLIRSLGSAFRPQADPCREALVQVLEHPSYTVQVYATHCLRALVRTCPQQLILCASICMNNVVRELGLLESGSPGRNGHRRCVGYANGLAAVISVSPSQPLYGSLEISSRVLGIATKLLKSSSQADLRIADTQVQVAWILIGGLMALGPNFVKIHLAQFLLLWKNALPKPLTKDNTKQRQPAELHYLTSIRECTLGSILLFLEFNSKLITTDVARRLTTLLHNTVEFLNSLPARKLIDDGTHRSTSSLTIQDLILMVRRRVLQCHSKLVIVSPHISAEILSQSSLLTFATTIIADPESYTPGSLSSSIANTSGTFDSIWDVTDNSGFGISGLVSPHNLRPIAGEVPCQADNLTTATSVDQKLTSPICGGREHDSVFLHITPLDASANLPDPPATEVVNAAISLFAVAFPLQTPKIQEGILEQIALFLASPSLQKDPGRRAAITVNAAMALLATIKVTVGETLAEKGDTKSQTVERAMEELMRTLLLNPDNTIRKIAYESIGRLCNSAGNAFTSAEVDSLIETIVANRDPSARAGCSMALGSIHEQVGGLAAGLHMKKIHGILMSLCSDPNSVVHSCAIKALSQVAESAGLTFSGNVPSTLGLLAQLWTSDSHNEQSESATTSNLEVEGPTAIVIAHCLDALINVLGPDIQDMSKVRELMLTLMRQFEADEVSEVQIKNLKAWEHMNLYDSVNVDLSTYVFRLQRNLDSSSRGVRNSAIDGLYNLMRRDAEMIIGIGNQKLEDQIWMALNEEPQHEGLQNIIAVWLSQSGTTETDKWITRCQQVLTKISKEPVESNHVPEPKSAAPDLQDEEVAGFNVGESKDQVPGVPEAAQELLRWQVRTFAMQCLNNMVGLVGKDIEGNPDSPAGLVLQNRVADVIRLGFLASTANVVELQVGGLKLIDQILKIFGSIPDPDFSEALLLEQYQAQISSALTPAFAADSSPDLASAAVNVCATFLSAGLVTDVERMGRILKLLVTALESFTDDAQDSAVGDLRGLSTNAQTMIKLSVLSAWAELQVASTHHEYLVKVVQGHVAQLTPLWLSSLQEFARLRFEPDISSTTGPARPDEALDVVYAALNRQTLLKASRCLLHMERQMIDVSALVEAIASLIDQDSDFVFNALDGKVGDSQPTYNKAERDDINYRDEPAAFFFVLFGIVIEALTIRPGSDTQQGSAHTIEILSALGRILKPSVAGNAIFQDTVFSETMELFDRLALTEGLEVQLTIVGIVKDMCIMHPSAKSDHESEEHLSEDIEQLFELTRIIVLVIAGVLPNLSEQNPSARPQLPEESVTVIQKSLEALVDAAEIFPSVIKNDLHASILHIFATILGTGACQATVVPQALPVFKRFLQRICASDRISSSSCDLVRGCLHRFLFILSHAQRRESESSLPCAKNTMLACTILLTTASRAFETNDPLIERTLDAIRDCLQDVGLAKVAANCLRSLILVSPKNATDEAIAQRLIPHLIHFTVDTELKDPEGARSTTAQALTSFVGIYDEEKAAPAMCLVLPVLLTRAASEGKEVYPQIATRLLELAGGKLTSVFRAVVGKMSVEQRGFMERVIREGEV
ncbi:uncharacterized protein KY384_003563 [Bacidia gigantensis]|uniref:uncharacterized protein n=1 Tax=Bacidia gigantensis TaxID=2732470 RepID=UPI001D03C8B4|nr:uncharacterized protein KY384_003563 [Bacidia gigantensis]KAG8531927.1 hypothetical protein KY384_003563 [Bacidia gigantensis]